MLPYIIYITHTPKKGYRSSDLSRGGGLVICDRLHDRWVVSDVCIILGAHNILIVFQWYICDYNQIIVDEKYNFLYPCAQIPCPHLNSEEK